jgi:hypothetical protein
MSTWQYDTATFRSYPLSWKWEEIELRDCSQIEGLNQFGARGFELVAAVTHIEDGNTEAIEYTFKKRLGE